MTEVGKWTLQKEGTLEKPFQKNDLKLLFECDCCGELK